MRLTLAAVAEATGGRVVGGPPETAVDGASMDSRTLDPGSLFVAVRADRDGHDFVGDAFERGAAAALVARDVEAAGPLVVVDDTERALTALGSAARERLGGIPVVGITGSAGKTSTKDLCRGALAASRPVHASPASFNNEIGVPLTLLATPPDVAAVVVEMGARGVGHIAALAGVVRPTVGVVTTVGAAHIELFGSVDEVAKAKGELLEALPDDGVGVVGDGHPWVDALVARSRADVFVVGSHPGADVVVDNLRVDSELRARFDLRSPWGSAEIALAVRGAHQAANAAMAATVALALGDPLDAVVAGLAQAEGSPWRMELERTRSGVIVVNDAYNANPMSTAAALEALAALDVAGRRWAVLGEMAELGDDAAAEHERVGQRAADLGVDVVVTVGAAAAPAAEAAAAAGVETQQVSGPDGALTLLAAAIEPGDAVLLKGSRVAGLERVAEALLAHPHVDLPRVTDTDAVDAP